MINLKSQPNVVIEEINEKIYGLDDLINQFKEKRDVYSSFEKWRKDVKKALDRHFSNDLISNNFIAQTKVLPNKFSKNDTNSKVGDALKISKDELENLKKDIELGRYSLENRNENLIDKTMVLIIIRKILNNFYKHIEAMYQDKVHGKGTIKKEDLDRINIGNEYDVQRILYSIIRPIFPEARLEVVEDTGYHSVRSDIKLDQYSVVIEVKCTRTNMTEHKLAEELGADSFHYNSEYLFLFIFDKEKLIKNPDAFKQAFKRNRQNFGKEVETVIVQEITF